MFWGKQSDGFEWHKHVRTTIKLRRDDRRRRIEDVKHAAVEGIKDASRAGVAAGASGFSLLLQGTETGARALLSGAHSFLVLTAAALSSWLSSVAQITLTVVRATLLLLRAEGGRGLAWFATVLRPASRPLTRSGVQPIVLLIAAMAALSAAAGLAGGGLTAETTMALAVAGAALMLALLPVLVGAQSLPYGLDRVVWRLAERPPLSPCSDRHPGCSRAAIRDCRPCPRYTACPPR